MKLRTGNEVRTIDQQGMKLEQQLDQQGMKLEQQLLINRTTTIDQWS